MTSDLDVENSGMSREAAAAAATATTLLGLTTEMLILYLAANFWISCVLPSFLPSSSTWAVLSRGGDDLACATGGEDGGDEGVGYE